MKIHHIGYLVKRLEKAAAAFTALFVLASCLMAGG